jgi:hypothetical protein
MTEAEWLVSGDPEAMVEYVVPRRRGAAARVSDRKARLFEVACCRRVWGLIPDGVAREAVLVAERYADGRASDRERRHAANRAAEGAGPEELPAINAGHAALLTTKKTCGKNFYYGGAPAAVAYAASPRGPAFRLDVYQAALRGEREAQSGLARCVFGNPFRPVSFDPAWRTADVTALVASAYEERLMPSGELDPHRLSILADALEEVGASEEVVAHLRSPEVHVRGCWAVDLCLGRS